jgi:hypothetical protein
LGTCGLLSDGSADFAVAAAERPQKSNESAAFRSGLLGAPRKIPPRRGAMRNWLAVPRTLETSGCGYRRSPNRVAEWRFWTLLRTVSVYEAEPVQPFKGCVTTELERLGRVTGPLVPELWILGEFSIAVDVSERKFAKSE